MTRSEFEKLIQEGITKIPKKFRDKLDNVAITIQDYPTQDQLRKLNLSQNSLLFGLYQGVPQTKRGVHYGMVLPDKITIFRKPIETVAKTKQAIRQTVAHTIWHEIAHHFGTSEKRIREIEMRRN